MKVAAHALVDAAALDADAVAVPEETHHHFARVLRLRAGENVTVTDGQGGFRRTIVGSDFATTGALVPTSAPDRASRPSPAVAVGIALAKGDKPEVAVQKLTELGVDRIVIFEASHSVVRWDEDKRRRNLERLRAVAIGALQQSRGRFLPRVEVAAFASLAAEAGVVRADVGGRPPTPSTDRLVLIGPEGGWSDDERAAVPVAIALAPTVLRAETAAVVAGSLWVAVRAGLVTAIG